MATSNTRAQIINVSYVRRFDTTLCSELTSLFNSCMVPFRSLVLCSQNQFYNIECIDDTYNDFASVLTICSVTANIQHVQIATRRAYLVASFSLFLLHGSRVQRQLRNH